MPDTFTAPCPEAPVPGRRLGRHIEHDPRSRAHDVDARTAAAPIRAVEWRRHSPILDQGDLGACTGNALTGWLACEPRCTSPVAAAKYGEDFAVALYEIATRLDRIPGHYPPDDTGSSGLAVVKAARRLGEITAYSWAFTTGGLLRALQRGPVIVGISWYEGFDHPDDHGVVRLGGQVRGGHEVLVRGYRPAGIASDGLLVCDNSWGPGWARDGSFAIPLAAWERLRAERADVTVPHP